MREAECREALLERLGRQVGTRQAGDSSEEGLRGQSVLDAFRGGFVLSTGCFGMGLRCCRMASPISHAETLRADGACTHAAQLRQHGKIRTYMQGGFGRGTCSVTHLFRHARLVCQAPSAWPAASVQPLPETRPHLNAVE